MSERETRQAREDLQYVTEVLRHGTVSDLEELATLVEGFPSGVDGWTGRRWLLHAIDGGSRSSIEWMLRQGVDLSSVDEDGYSPLLSLIEHTREDRYDLLRRLLESGARTDRHGINDWTPLHLAAARNDVKALEILVEHGADPTVRTRIDDQATPLEEARSIGCDAAVAFLKTLG